MGNRIQGRPYKQVSDSVEFLLVKAKLRAQLNSPQEAVNDFQIQLKERKFSSEAAVRYGMAQARLRAGDIAGAERELNDVRRLKLVSPMLETLAAELRAKQNDFPAAIRLLGTAHVRYPQDRAITYAYVAALQEGSDASQALKVVSEELTSYPSDARLHGLQAKSYALLGQRTEQHRAQAEAYVLQGQLAAAIIQLEWAQKANDGNFYAQSQVDARLRELKKQQIEELKQKKM
jgi:predicted Zn-dependent protease